MTFEVHSPGGDRRCSRCNAPLDPSVAPDGCCAHCLLQFGLGDLPADPESVGPYRIVEPLGEGGMGIVYHAEQERPIRRRVALKLIKPGMDTRQILARFESERQALAIMNHPAVARVFDAGATEDGRPYFAMEYVAGLPITEHCDTHRLGARDRLKLFVRVCDAVQHAHQNAIIHRDLKPSNILVATDEGRSEPKIIDFGIAKATDRHLNEHSTQLTGSGQIVGTPEYMSPEQLSSSVPVDTRTDVYSLGVLLYELLVGARPFTIGPEDGTFEEVRHKIRTEDPPRPSSKAGSRQLRGDLDWIVMKTLEKDPDRRYVSPAELAADIERHLERKPVLACPPSTTYRIGRFVRRHRVAVSAAVIVVIGLATGAFAAAMGLARAERETRATARISDYLIRLVGVADPSRGRGTARALLDEGAARLSELGDQPLVQARLMDQMGVAYTRLGQFEQARELIEQGLTIRERELLPHDLDLASSRMNLGDLLVLEGDFKRAQANFEKALEIRQQSLGSTHPDVATSMERLGTLMRLIDDELARPLYDRALDLREGALGPDHPDVAESLQALGRLATASRDYEIARRRFEEALAIRKSIHGDQHPAVASTLRDLASLSRSTGDYVTALQLMQQVTDCHKEFYSAEHPEVAKDLHETGRIHADMGDSARAKELFEQALMLQAQSLGGGHPDVATTYIDLGRLHMGLNQCDLARPLFERAVAIREAAFGPSHPQLAHSLNDLADTMRCTGDYENAVRLHQRATAIRENILGPEHPDVAQSLVKHGQIRADLGEYDFARSLYERALAIYESKLKPDDPRLADILVEHARFFELVGDSDEAQRLLTRAERVRSRG